MNQKPAEPRKKINKIITNIEIIEKAEQNSFLLNKNEDGLSSTISP